MTKGPFALALVRKSQKALTVARLALSAGDNDSAINRAYYAMFDIALAALLRAGIIENKLRERITELSRRFAPMLFSQGKLIDNSQPN